MVMLKSSVADSRRQSSSASDDDDDNDINDDANDSDKELQVALKEGLLKSDKLNYVALKKRPIINKKEDLLAKLKQFKKELPWLETVDITISNEDNHSSSIDDDFEREIIFYKQGQKAANEAFLRLKKMGVKVLRPPDYYAQMAKTDEHMQKVRKRMAAMEEGKMRQEAIRRLRDEKKFAAKAHKQVAVAKDSEKKKLVEAVNMHRKGMKSQLEVMLNNAKKLQDYEDEEKLDNNSRNAFRHDRKQTSGSNKKFGRIARDKKYGFGGQKKRSKKNNQKSFDEFVTPGSIAKKLKRRGQPGVSLKGSKQKRTRKSN